MEHVINDYMRFALTVNRYRPVTYTGKIWYSITATEYCISTWLKLTSVIHVVYGQNSYVTITE